MTVAFRAGTGYALSFTGANSCVTVPCAENLLTQRRICN